MIAVRDAGLVAAYRRLPEEVRRCLRPGNLAEEVASFLPARLRAPVATATEAARRLALLRRVRFPVWRVEGRAAGSDAPLRAVLAMDAGSAAYWRQVLFAPDARETALGDVRALDVPPRARTEAGDADVALWRLAWPLARGVPDALVVPSHVPMWIDTDRPYEAVLTGDRSGRAARKNDARRVGKLGLRVRVAHDVSEWERFRTALYEPYTRTRFGRLGLVIPRHVFRHARRQGRLLVLEDGERVVGGVVLERWGAEHRMLALGVAPDGAVPAGVGLQACYCHAIRFAVEHGWPRLCLGTVRPVATDGVYRYKRKWGASVGRPVTWDGFVLTARNTAGTRAALTAAPLLARHGDRTIALVGAEGLDAAAALERVDTRGLAEIRLVVAPDGGPLRIASPYTPVRAVAPEAAAPLAAA